jgi:Zn-dependent protease
MLVRINFEATLSDFFFLIVVVNVMLCIFNLIPIPPLDGSKVLEALLPRSWQYGYTRWRSNMERNPFIGMLVVIVIVLLLGGAFSNLIYDVASFVAGVSA